LVSIDEEQVVFRFPVFESTRTIPGKRNRLFGDGKACPDIPRVGSDEERRRPENRKRSRKWVGHRKKVDQHMLGSRSPRWRTGRRTAPETILVPVDNDVDITRSKVGHDVGYINIYIYTPHGCRTDLSQRSLCTGNTGYHSWRLVDGVGRRDEKPGVTIHPALVSVVGTKAGAQASIAIGLKIDHRSEECPEIGVLDPG
jgi:hypothetical protein